MKGSKISIVFLFSVFFYSSCETQTNKTTHNTFQIHNLSQISDSTFISRIRYTNIVTNQEEKVGDLVYIVKDNPNKNNSYYIIQVGKKNSYRLEIFYNFYCYPKTGEIKLYDAFKDTLIEAK